MDSLTQIILGAATGEVVLGKKLGNRAMVWGAVGGTIPDLDVLGGLVLSELDNLAFHRGISHSITFSMIGGLFIGWLVYWIYKSKYHKWIAIATKIFAAILVTAALNFLFSRFFPGNYIPLIIAGLLLGFWVYADSKRRYFGGNWQPAKASRWDWQLLFICCLFTHIILDSFTMYGTQLFAPFSDLRVSWGTISVADPFYTIPFLICLIVASRFSRETNKRRVWNYVGIGISSMYLLFTIVNKQQINKVFTSAMKEQNIPYERYVTNATILNNILWNVTAETEDHFYLAQYSWFDKGEIEFNMVDKNHDLLEDPVNDITVKTLRWFTDDYFIINNVEKGLQLSDLRFGTFTGKGDNPDDFIFRFLLIDNGDEGYTLQKAEGGPPEGTQDELFASLWERIKGI